MYSSVISNNMSGIVNLVWSWALWTGLPGHCCKISTCKLTDAIDVLKYCNSEINGNNHEQVIDPDTHFTHTISIYEVIENRIIALFHGKDLFPYFHHLKTFNYLHTCMLEAVKFLSGPLLMQTFWILINVQKI